MKIKIIFKEKSHTMFLWKYRKQFRQTFRKLFTRSPKKTYEAIIFSNKSFLQKFSSENLECSFDNLAASLSPEARRKFVKLHFFSIKSFFPKMILWKLRFRFRQPCRKNFTRTPQKFMTLNFFLKLKVSS